MDSNICHYKFPIHPTDMIFEGSHITSEKRSLRVNIITLIAELSSCFNQHELDNKTFVEVDSHKNVIGYDASELLQFANVWCSGEKIPLGRMTANAWIQMRID